MKRFLLSLSIIMIVLLGGLFRYGRIEKDLTQQLGPVATDLNGIRKMRAVLDCHACLNEILTPINPNALKSFFDISSGESVGQISKRLCQEKLISSEQAFGAYLVYSGQDRQLRPGRYTLSAGMNIPQIASRISGAGGQHLTFAFLPGMRLEEIAALIDEAEMTFSGSEFLSLARQYPPYDGISLEGHLLPGSYEMDRDISLEKFLAGFMKIFERNIRPMEAQFAELGLTLEQGLILASMITREAISADEYGTIASVFYNRLYAGMSFQSDPTVQYALGMPGAWWKSPLSAADLTVNSAFNTYVIDGFPPTAICAPAFDAILAVTQPPQTPYYYFRARCDGTPYHNFSVTLAEHNANACEE